MGRLLLEILCLKFSVTPGYIAEIVSIFSCQLMQVTWTKMKYKTTCSGNSYFLAFFAC